MIWPLRKTHFRFLIMAAFQMAWTFPTPPMLLGDPPDNHPEMTPIGNKSKPDFLKSKKPVLVDFWATWCEPCRVSGPIVDRIRRDFDGKLRLVRIEADKNPELAKVLHVENLPTLILFQNGKVVREWVGVVSERDLRAEINKALGKSYPPDPGKIGSPVPEKNS